MHTRLTEAAREGRLEDVRSLIAGGMNIDGSDGPTYNDVVDGCVTGAPYYRPLAEAARAGKTEVVGALLALGADVNAVDYRGENALILAASANQLASVKLLLAAGGDVHRIGCLGNALAVIQPGAHDRALETATLLLEAGCSPIACAPWASAALDNWLAAVKGKQRDPRAAAVTYQLLRAALPSCGARAVDVASAIAALDRQLADSSAKAARAAANFSKLAASGATAEWAENVRAKLGPLSQASKREAVEHVCSVVLAHSSGYGNAEWPALVREVLALSRSYSDATEAAYGKRLPLSAMEADDGGALDAFAAEHLYTWDWLLKLLRQPRIVGHHAAWADLVIEVCRHKQAAVGYHSFGDDELAALLAMPAAKRHPRYREIVACARGAFPFAPCFNADGELSAAHLALVDPPKQRPATKPKARAAKKSKRPPAKRR